MIEENEILGISIPIQFTRYKTIKRKIDENIKIINEIMNLYFSFRDMSLNEVDLFSPGRNQKYKNYHQYNIYGVHRYLIPSTPLPFPLYENEWGVKYSFGQIGKNPTTATYHQRLALIPCQEENISLFKIIQEQPFLIEVNKVDGFLLHIKNTENKYHSLQSRLYSPTCWHGFAHPVITLQYDGAYKPVHNLSEIPWEKLHSIGKSGHFELK